MNRELYSGHWNVLKGKIKEQWGDLTDDDLTQIEGKRDQLLGFLQKRYGYDKARAEKELANWEKEIEAEYLSKPKH